MVPTTSPHPSAQPSPEKQCVSLLSVWDVACWQPVYISLVSTGFGLQGLSVLHLRLFITFTAASGLLALV